MAVKFTPSIDVCHAVAIPTAVVVPVSLRVSAIPGQGVKFDAGKIPAVGAFVLAHQVIQTELPMLVQVLVLAKLKTT